MTHPRSPFAARIAGLNLLHGTGVDLASTTHARSARTEHDFLDESDVDPSTGAAALTDVYLADGDQSVAGSDRFAGAAEVGDHPDGQQSVADTPRLTGATGRPDAEAGREFRPESGEVPKLGTVSVGAGGAQEPDPVTELTVDGRVVGDFTPGARAAAVFSPAAVAVFTEPPGGSPRNVFTVDVTEITDRGGIVRVRADAPRAPGLCADLTPAAVTQLDLTVGARVFFAVKATEVRVYAC
ncbi:TOBE domain-containing protein [Nocardia halotolerans]|uniref:TOBE domain-containing protein n=1 Tax=Nocardia halotolerans TaxID=1755878 RepID=A0ABV8VE55_9NOCA